MKTWPLSAGWHIVHGKLAQTYARLVDSKRLYSLGKEEELVGRLQHRLHMSGPEIMHLLRRNHAQWPSA